MVNNHSIKGIQSESKGWLLQHSSHGHCVMVKHCALHVLQILIAFKVVKILFCLHVANFSKSQATMQCLGQSGSACLKKSDLHAYTSKDWSFLLSYRIYSLHCKQGGLYETSFLSSTQTVTIETRISFLPFQSVPHLLS